MSVRYTSFLLTAIIIRNIPVSVAGSWGKSLNKQTANKQKKQTPFACTESRQAVPMTRNQNSHFLSFLRQEQPIPSLSQLPSPLPQPGYHTWRCKNCQSEKQYQRKGEREREKKNRDGKAIVRMSLSERTDCVPTLVQQASTLWIRHAKIDWHHAQQTQLGRVKIVPCHLINASLVNAVTELTSLSQNVLWHTYQIDNPTFQSMHMHSCKLTRSVTRKVLSLLTITCEEFIENTKI